MTTNTLTSSMLFHLDKQAKLPVLATVLVKAAVIVTQWSTLYRTRQALSQLEPHILDDIGVTPADAAREAERPFWQGHRPL